MPTITIRPTPGSERGTIGGPWADYSPPEPAGPAPDGTAPGGSPGGPWAEFTAPPGPETPQREIGSGEALGRGVAQALTFGTAPALSGLAAASGIEAQPAPPGQDPGNWFDPNPVRPIVGAAKLIGNYFSSHPDEKIKQAYEQGRKDAEETQKQAAKQHPYAYHGGQLGGTVATLPFTGGAGTAATVGGRLLQGIKAGGIGGGLFGGGEAIGEGGTFADVAKGTAGGAAVGATLGGVLGSAIEGIAGTAKKVASVVRGARDAEGEAGSRVVSALAADRPQVQKVMRDAPALKAGTEAGTPFYNVDFGGENTRALLRSAANTSPTARNIIGDKLHSRYRQQAERFSGYLRSKFNGLDREGGLEAIKTQARRENAPKYKYSEQLADRMYPRGVWSPKLEQLLGSDAVPAAMQGAIKSGRDKAVAEGAGAFKPKVTFENGILKTDQKGGVPAYPDMKLWDYTQRELGDMGNALKRAGHDDKAAAVFNLKRQLLEELDRLNPAFKEARGTAAAFFKAGDALEAGANFVKDGTISTIQATRALAKMSPSEQELFRRGFASELAEQIEKKGYRSDVLNSMFIDSPRAVQRIRVALGEQGASEFEALVRIEGIVNRARNALGNSTTIRQLNEAGLAGGAGILGAVESIKGAINPAYLLAGAFIIGGKQAAHAIDEKVAVRVAEMLLSHNPEELARGYKIISQNPIMRDALRGAGNVGIRDLINYARPSGVAAGMATAYKMLPGTGSAAQPVHHSQDDEQSQPPAQPVH